MFNHIYCCCITGSLFSLLLAAERITRMPMEENKNFFLWNPSDASTCCSPPSSICHVNLEWRLFLVWLSPRYVWYSSSRSSHTPFEAAAENKQGKQKGVVAYQRQLPKNNRSGSLHPHGERLQSLAPAVSAVILPHNWWPADYRLLDPG